LTAEEKRKIKMSTGGDTNPKGKNDEGRKVE